MLKRLLFLLVFVVRAAWGAVALDIASTGQNMSFLSPVTFSFACSTCTPNLYLRLSSGEIVGGAETAVSYNSVSMTKVVSYSPGSANVAGNTAYTIIYEMKNPPTGSHTASITFTNGAVGGTGAAFYTGVAQTGSSSGTSYSAYSGSGTNPATVSVSSTTSGNLIDDAFICICNNSGITGTGILNWTGNYIGVWYGQSQYYSSTGSAVTDSWTSVGNSGWALTAVEILAAGGAAAVTKMQAFIMGANDETYQCKPDEWLEAA